MISVLSCSRFGRVNFILALRLELLKEVERLQKSLDVSGDVGYTCETAGHFFLYQVDDGLSLLARGSVFHSFLAGSSSLGELLQQTQALNREGRTVVLSCDRHVVVM